jgi:hypothetical protein
MSYYQHDANQRLPDRARLGQGTLGLLAQIQAVEKISVDVIVAKAVQSYFEKLKLQEKRMGDTNGQEKGNIKH